MKLPFVSRDRYEELLLRETRLEAKLERLMNHIMDMTHSPEPVPERPEGAAPAFAFPPEVFSAVSQRSHPGSQQAIRLFDWARVMLEGGEMEPAEVAARILAGDDNLGTDW